MRTVQAYCHYAFDWIRISATGEVSMCCWQQIDTLGNIFEKSFNDIWYGEKARDVRKTMKRGEMHALCVTRGCPWLYKDRTLQTIEFPPYPTNLEIYLPNTMCNEKCIMCPRSALNFIPESDKTKEIIEKISFLFPHVRRLQFLGLAEPFYKNLVFDALNLVNWELYKHQIVLTLFTNGTILNDKNREKFFSTVPRSWVTFSIDASTKETYHKIRSLNAFDLVMKNLYAYSAQRKPSQHLAINNNINMLNVGEVENMVWIGSDAGVEFINFSVTDPDSDKILPYLLNKDNAHLFKEAQEKIVNLADKLKIKVVFTQPLDKNLTK